MGIVGRKSLVLAVAVVVWASVMSFEPEPAGALADVPAPLRPYRPLWVIAANSVIPRVLRTLGYDPETTPSLDADDLLSAAQSRTGLTEIGDEDGLFAEGLKRLCWSLQHESKLTPLGRIVMKEQLALVISNRLKLVQYAAERNLRADKIDAPVFTVGMPRSGTTFLHNLLSQDMKRFRAMRTWEYVDPVPPLGGDTGWLGVFLRLLPIELNMMGFRALAPTVNKVYPIGPHNAEECMPVLGSAMVSLQYNTLSNVSKYNDWQMQQPAPFKTHEMFYQVLQSSVPKELRQRWLFKAPWHMNHIAALFAAYPDAKILMPHRDPSGFLTSLCSLHARFYGIVSDDINPKSIGQYQLGQWKEVLRRFVEQREALPAAQQDQIMDIHFKDLIKNPISVVKQIYAKYGWVLSAEAEEAMRQWLATDKQLGKKGAKGKHEYQPEWFGLTETDMADAFAGYIQRYNLSSKYRHSSDV